MSSNLSVDQYSQLIEEIRAILLMPGDPDVEVLQQTHQRYTQAVAELNERLRHCESLLQKGHRTEALDLCRREELLERVAVLDFPESAVWLDYVDQFGIAPGPALLVELAAEINDAYLAEESVEQLLVRYRLLNLARCPLSMRLRLLRRLAKEDPTNPHWSEDVRQFERLRLEQLAREVRRARQAQDVKTLARLEEELLQAPWSIAPPQALIQEVLQAHEQARRRHARKELKQLAQELNDAFSGFDVELARQLRQRWETAVELAEVEPTDPILEIAAPALEWLEQEDVREAQLQEHREAVAHLEELLESNSGTLEEIERTVEQATRHGHSLPKELQRRAERHIAGLSLARRRRRLAMVAFVILLIAGVGIATAFVIQQQLLARRIEEHVQLISQLLEQEELEEAQERLQHLAEHEPQVFQSQSIQELRQRWKQLHEKEQLRQGELRRLLDGAHAVLVGSPSWEELDAALENLREATKLCKTAAEKLQVKEVEQLVQQKRSQLRKSLDAAFTQEVEKLVRQEAAMEQDDRQQLESLLSQAEALKRRPRVSRTLVGVGSRLHRLILKLKERLKLAEQNEQRQQHLEAIAAAVGNPAGYTNALQHYRRSFPRDPRGQDMQEVVALQSACWAHLTTWNEGVRLWLEADITRITPFGAKRRLDSLDKLRELGKTMPLFLELEQRLGNRVAYARSLLGRRSSQGKLLTDQLKAVRFSSPLFDDRLMMVETKDGKRFYTSVTPQITDDGMLVVRYWQNLTGKRMRTTTLNVNQVANPRKEGRFVWVTPQIRFLQRVGPHLARVTETNWEPGFLTLARETYRSDMDPVLKLSLLQDILHLGGEGSWALKQIWQPVIERIEQAKVELAAPWWIDPRDPRGDQQRRSAAMVLESLPDPAGLEKRINQLLKELAQKPRGVYEMKWIGFAFHDGKRWIGQVSESGGRHHGRVAIIKTDERDMPVRWLFVGTVRGARVQLDPSSREHLLNGMPLFVALADEPQTNNGQR